MGNAIFTVTHSENEKPVISFYDHMCWYIIFNFKNSFTKEKGFSFCVGFWKKQKDKLNVKTKLTFLSF